MWYKKGECIVIRVVKVVRIQNGTRLDFGKITERDVSASTFSRHIDRFHRLDLSVIGLSDVSNVMDTFLDSDLHLRKNR